VRDYTRTESRQRAVDRGEDGLLGTEPHRAIAAKIGLALEFRTNIEKPCIIFTGIHVLLVRVRPELLEWIKRAEAG
jgi:hypothetical protein